MQPQGSAIPTPGMVFVNPGDGMPTMQPQGSAIPAPGMVFVNPGDGMPAMWTPGTALPTLGTGIPTPGTGMPTPGTGLPTPGTAIPAPGTAIGLGTAMEFEKAAGSYVADGLETPQENTAKGARLVATVGMALLLVLTIGAAVLVVVFTGGWTSGTTEPTYPGKIPDITRRPPYTPGEHIVKWGVTRGHTIPEEEITMTPEAVDYRTWPPATEEISTASAITKWVNSTLGSPPPIKKRYQFIKTPLVCVYGTGLNTTTPFPGDGICQLFIFDSLHKEGKNPWNNPGTELELFLKQARSYSASQFGFSFDFENRRKLLQALSDGTAADNVGKYWNDNIHHYGMLDISPYHETEADVLAAVELFKHLYPLLESRASSGVSTHIVFGFSPISQKWISFIPSLFEKFRPDVFILRGHYSLINDDKPNCKILPVTLMNDVPEAPFTLVTAHNALKEVAAKASGNDISLAVSVSAAGRWYRPVNYARKKEWDYAPFQPCTRLPEGYGQFGNIGELCIQRFQKPPVPFSVDEGEYRYSFRKGLTIVYNSQDSFKKQLCRLKQNTTEVTYGVAVFDMEYNDYIDNCMKGVERFQVLQKVTEYFRNTEAFDFDKCAPRFSP